MALRVHSTLTREKADFTEGTGKKPGDVVTM